MLISPSQVIYTHAIDWYKTLFLGESISNSPSDRRTSLVFGKIKRYLRVQQFYIQDIGKPEFFYEIIANSLFYVCVGEDDSCVSK